MKSKCDYKKKVDQIANDILDYTEKTFIPNLRKYIKVKEVWDPIKLHQKILTPTGSLYGQRGIKKTIFHKIKSETPIPNLHFVGATSSFPGIPTIIRGSMDVYEKLKKIEADEKKNT